MSKQWMEDFETARPAAPVNRYLVQHIRQTLVAGYAPTSTFYKLVMGVAISDERIMEQYTEREEAKKLLQLYRDRTQAEKAPSHADKIIAHAMSVA